jgi:DNA repair ATPase RecN
MDITAINSFITELESSETSLSNIRNLAALYSVRDRLVKENERDNTIKELNDILPSYIAYVDAKKRYQTHKGSTEDIMIELRHVCKEIKEFVGTLYSGTDTVDERKLIKKSLAELQATI